MVLKGFFFSFFKNLNFKGTVHEMESLEESYEMDRWSPFQEAEPAVEGSKDAGPVENTDEPAVERRSKDGAPVQSRDEPAAEPTKKRRKRSSVVKEKVVPKKRTVKKAPQKKDEGKL